MSDTLDQIAAHLAKVVRGGVFADILHRAAYSTDASIYTIVPACVVAPRDSGDIAAAVKYAATKGIPVVARGAGSGLAGEALAQEYPWLLALFKFVYGWQKPWQTYDHDEGFVRNYRLKL